MTESTPTSIRLTLTHTADAELYDLPLTLVTQVPAGWAKVTVSQGDQRRVVEAKDGLVRYEARADGVEVRLERAP